MVAARTRGEEAKKCSPQTAAGEFWGVIDAIDERDVGRTYTPPWLLTTKSEIFYWFSMKIEI